MIESLRRVVLKSWRAGALAIERARADLAARLFGAAAAWRRAIGIARLRCNQADYEQSYASTRRRLSSADWMRQFERGERLTFEETHLDAEKIILDLTDWCRSSLVAHLTKREVEVLQLLAEGASNPEIAALLVLSRRTVDAHLRSIFDKLGVYFFEHAQMVTIRWGQGRMNEVAERVRVHGERHPLIARWRNAFWAAEVGDEVAARERWSVTRGTALAICPATALDYPSVLAGGGLRLLRTRSVRSRSMTSCRRTQFATLSPSRPCRTARLRCASA